MKLLFACTVPSTRPPKLCSLSNVSSASFVSVPTELIFKPTPNFLNNLSFVSLVKLFLSELVATSPRGLLFAKDTDAGGLSFKLSLSTCGYKSTTF